MLVIKEVLLPHPWPALIHHHLIGNDLIEIAKVFKLVAEKRGFSDVGKKTLELTGEGFFVPFSMRRFLPKDNDTDYAFKIKFLTALEGLSEEFGKRISSVVWNTLAFLGTRPNPHEEATILKMREYLPLPWWFADSVLHALGKVYGLKLHIDSRIFQNTQMVLEHSRDCNLSILPPIGGQLSCFISKSKFNEATEALLTHIFCESLMIGGLKLPLEMDLK